MNGIKVNRYGKDKINSNNLKLISLQNYIPKSISE